MPELPEVETIKRVIEPQIQGLMNDKVNVKRPEVVAYPMADEFCGRLTGQTISYMTRRGKFLVIQLNSNDRIILHLRMTGCLLLTPADCPEEKHTHITFSLNKGKELRFSDTRCFGRFWLMKKDEADTYSGIEKLGAEPLDKQLTTGYLQARLGKRKKSRERMSARPKYDCRHMQSVRICFRPMKGEYRIPEIQGISPQIGQ